MSRMWFPLHSDVASQQRRLDGLIFDHPTLKHKSVQSVKKCVKMCLEAKELQKGARGVGICVYLPVRVVILRLASRR